MPTSVFEKANTCACLEEWPEDIICSTRFSCVSMPTAYRITTPAWCMCLAQHKNSSQRGLSTDLPQTQQEAPQFNSPTSQRLEDGFPEFWSSRERWMTIHVLSSLRNVAEAFFWWPGISWSDTVLLEVLQVLWNSMTFFRSMLKIVCSIRVLH